MRREALAIDTAAYERERHEEELIRSWMAKRQGEPPQRGVGYTPRLGDDSIPF